MCELMLVTLTASSDDRWTTSYKYSQLLFELIQLLEAVNKY